MEKLLKRTFHFRVMPIADSVQLLALKPDSLGRRKKPERNDKRSFRKNEKEPKKIVWQNCRQTKTNEKPLPYFSPVDYS